MRDKVYTKWIILQNKILLSILKTVFLQYRKTSTEYTKSLPPASVWSTTLKDEETILNQFERVLIRRSGSMKQK